MFWGGGAHLSPKALQVSPALSVTNHVPHLSTTPRNTIIHGIETTKMLYGQLINANAWFTTWQHFKLRMLVPVHKGKECDPLICNNYQNITFLRSFFLKSLFLGDCSLYSLKRVPISISNCILNWTIMHGFASRSHLKHIREGDTPYLCIFLSRKGFWLGQVSHTPLSHLHARC